VARKPKTPDNEKPAEDGATLAENGKLRASESKKKARAAGATTKKKKSPAAKQPSAKESKIPVPKPVTTRPAEPTEDEIRLRAYFLAERRHRLSLPGDSNHDWIEARRQLIEEAQ
jgi:hypothetical protein